MRFDSVLFNALLAGTLISVPIMASAAEAGRVQYLAGTLSVQKKDGSVKILSQGSEVEPGDFLGTEKDSYAQINFTDGSQATLRPNSRLKIENYQFRQEAPQADNLLMRLVRGGLRSVTGFIGKRGNQDAYRINTATATIGIRGSSGDTLECSVGCAGVTSTSGSLAPGVYHTTYTGSYVLTNPQGSQIIGEGQFGFAAPGVPPVLLPSDPGLNLRELPFTLGIVGRPGADTGPKDDDDCSLQ